MQVLPQYLLLLIADCFLQQTAANVDQIRDTEERIESIGGILAYPIGAQDDEEQARRETLRRFVFPLREISIHHRTALSIHRKLAGITAKLEPLSEQHKIMKFLKNADHASILNGFVQDLACAVADYQVWNAASIAGIV